MRLLRPSITTLTVLAITATLELENTAIAQCSPQMVGSIATPGDARGLAMSGDLACVAASSSVVLLDISDPIAPNPIGSYPGLLVKGVEIIGDMLCIVDPFGAFSFLDISDPTSPTLISTYTPTNGGPQDALAKGSLLFAVGSAGMAIFDTSNPGPPVLLSEDDTVDEVLQVASDGTYAYLATASPGSPIFDVTNPSAPVQVGQIPGHAWSVHVAGDLAYVGGQPTLRTFDISDRTAPVELDSLEVNPSNPTLAIEVVDGIAYLASRFDGVTIVDVSDPNDLELITQVPTSGLAVDVIVRDQLMYATDFGDGLVVTDVAVCPQAIEYCPATTMNSAGLAGTVLASGAGMVAANDVVLRAENLPVGSMGYFLGSQSRLSIPNIGGSQGTLCIGVPITRFVALAGTSDATGAYEVALDLNDIPPPLNGQPLVGETWNFQFWYRDQNPTSTSNMTGGVEIRFW